MDEPLAQALVIRPARSLYLAKFLVSAHLGALAASAGSGLPAHFKALAILLVLFSAARVIRDWRTGFNHTAGYVFVLTAAGAWLRQEPNGEWVPLVAMPPVFVHPFLIVIRLRSISAPVSRHDLVLAPDSLDPDTTRRLRVRLRFPP